MRLLPAGMYGLEVPADGVPVPCYPDFPATIRITMAALDPSESVTTGLKPRATLKIIREIDDDEDDDDDDDEDLDQLLADSASESESDSDDEKVNGGPSDPKKSKKAQRMDEIKKLIKSVGEKEDSDEEMLNGVSDGKKDKGKGKAGSVDEESSDDGEETGVEEFVLCTLDPEKVFQQPLDITIALNEQVYFKVDGSHAIYLTGNYLLVDETSPYGGRNILDSAEEEDEDEDYDLSPDEEEIELDMGDDDSDSLDDLDDPRITEVESDEEVAPKLVAKTATKSDKKGKNKRTADELESASLDDIMAKSLKPEVKTAVKEEPKLSKKQLKKLKKNNGEAVEVKSEGNQEAVKNGDANTSKKVQFAKNLEQGPAKPTEKSKPEEKTKEATANGKAALGAKTVNGVTIDDKKIGSGRSCKKGDRVGMRYIGKLKDGRVFDSNKKGKPFEFKLGSGEVIKGWDIGVVGMSIGGERRLIIPSNLAYGNKAMPEIPANSTLVFDIKLIEIK